MAEENKIFTVEIITPDRIFYKGEGDDDRIYNCCW